MADHPTSKSVPQPYTAGLIRYEAWPKNGPAEDARKRIVEAEAPPAISRRAVWLTHGMGQQIPFETLEAVTIGLQGAAVRAGYPLPQATARVVRIGEQTLRRVEMNVSAKDGRTHELHLYEAYWAPKTEGAVKLRDVMGFLVSGALRGLLKGRKFDRVLFGNIVTFPLTWRTPTYVTVALAVVTALAVINTIVVAAGAGVAFLPGEQTFTGEQYGALTALASVLTMVAISFGAVLFLAQLRKHSRDRQAAAGRGPAPTPSAVLSALVWVAFLLTVLLLLWIAGYMGWMTYRRVPLYLLASQDTLRAFATVIALLSVAAVLIGRYRPRKRLEDSRAETEWKHLGSAQAENPLLPAVFWFAFLLHLGAYAGLVLILCGIWGPPAPVVVSGSSEARDPLWSALTSSKWVWAFLFGLSATVRRLLVQYVGDVAAYVDSGKLDRFDELRERIRETVRKSAEALYLARAKEANRLFEYDRVAVAGHSLGSLIAYDTLNRLINDDGLSGGALNVVGRTSVLLTFGSPLDKTAYFFTVRGKDTGRMRERLATAVQPLIQDPENRTFPWINVWSPADIISGELNFYDDRDPVTARQVIPPPGRIVENVTDPRAVIPLVAHTDYWKNAVVWDRLFAEVTR